MYELLLKELNQNQYDELLIHQYCGLCFANWNLQQPLNVDLNPLKDYKIRYSESSDEPYFCDNQGEEVSAKRVMESNKFIVGRIVPLLFNNRIKTNPSLFLEDEIFVSTYDRGVIPSRFICSEIFTINYYNYTRLIKKDSDDIQWVANSNFNFKTLAEEYPSRYCYPGLHKYDRIVVGKDAPLLGFIKPYHYNCWIYPIRKDVKEELPSLRNDAEQYLREKDRMDAIVPDYIVKLIQKYNAKGNKNLTKEDIHNTYIQLILDNTFGAKEVASKKAVSKKRPSKSSPQKKNSSSSHSQE